MPRKPSGRPHFRISFYVRIDDVDVLSADSREAAHRLRAILDDYKASRSHPTPSGASAEGRQDETVIVKPVLCERCIRLGRVRNCPQCADLARGG